MGSAIWSILHEAASRAPSALADILVDKTQNAIVLFRSVPVFTPTPLLIFAFFKLRILCNVLCLRFCSNFTINYTFYVLSKFSVLITAAIYNTNFPLSKVDIVMLFIKTQSPSVGFVTVFVANCLFMCRHKNKWTQVGVRASPCTYVIITDSCCSV